MRKECIPQIVSYHSCAQIFLQFNSDFVNDHQLYRNVNLKKIIN